MSSIILKPDELGFIALMIDKRDSSHLSGHTTDAFRGASLNGGVTVIQFPGKTGGEQISTMTFERLLALDLFQVFTRNKTVTTFDLGDDIRDRLEQLKDEAGQPSLLAREREARTRAEDAQARQEARLDREARGRQERRHAFAETVGRRIRLAANVLLIVIYAAVTVAMAITTTPIIAVVTALVIVVLIGIFDWVFHRDAYGLVRWLEGQAVARVENWLASFEAPEE